MLYFSEIQKRKVHTEDGIFVGTISDLVFIFSDIPQVSKLYIKADPLDTFVHVPVADCTLFGDDIVLKKSYKNIDLDENELYLGKNVVDKQIIDIEGKKVVRVNDALLQFKGQKNIYITGVDIGIRAVFRWIGLEGALVKLFGMFGVELMPKILSWNAIQPLELSEGKVALKTQQEKLEKFLPEDLADYLETTNVQNAIKALDLVDREFASEVIAELQLNYQIALFEKLSFKKTVRIIELMDPDEAVDILLQFRATRRNKILKELPTTERNELQALMAVSRTNVGQYMTSEFIAVKRNDTVQDVLSMIKKKTSDYDFLFYIYVVNSRDELIGAITMHELLTHKSSAKIHTFMHTNIVLCYLNTPVHLVVRRMVQYKLYALPVISRKRNILGVVTLDDFDEFILEQLQ